MVWRKMGINPYRLKKGKDVLKDVMVELFGKG